MVILFVSIFSLFVFLLFSFFFFIIIIIIKGGHQRNYVDVTGPAERQLISVFRGEGLN